MEYAKIEVKSNYDKRGDLVLRSYVRALKKVEESRLLSGNSAFIYGIVDDNNDFHELFTNEIIDFDDYVYVDFDEIFNVQTMPNNRKELMKKIMEKVLFRKEKIFFDFEISTPEEASMDHYVEMDAYEKHLSDIEPYPHLSPLDDQSYMMAYDSLVHKINAIKNMRNKTKGQYVKK